MKAKEVLLLILIVVVGVGLYYLDNLKLTIDDWEVGSLFRGESYLFEEVKTEAPAGALEIVNSHGSIQIEGVETQAIEIAFEKRVWRKTEQEAREIADQIKLLATRDSQRLLLTTNSDTFRKKNFTTSFRVRVPRDTSIFVRNSYGLVRVAGVKEVELENRQGRVDIVEVSGPVRVNNSYEKVSIMDVDGECRLETKHSSALLSRIAGPVLVNCAYENLELFDLKSSLDLESRHTRIKAVRIAGPSKISGSYEQISLSETGPAIINGHHSPVEVDTARGQLEIETSYERIRLVDLEGDLVIRARSSRVDVTGARAARLQVETSYEPVNLEDFSGQLELKLKHANLTLSPLNLDYPILATTEYGNIKFFWPESQTARLEASSKGGRISWQLPFSPDENTTNGLAVVRVYRGAADRPEIKLTTSYGNIDILKKE
ncbi:MAG: DUF4097 family beta strand repeat protein [Candidatus Aminicenantes bacterium]|nr:DUF4097 family beta strand repeat protein [Candidatus Aminicenantes bacterium]